MPKGSRNRRAGNQYELDVLNKLLPFFPSLKTSRNLSKVADDKGIDLLSEDENNPCPFTIQVKNTVKSVDYSSLVERLSTEKGIPLIVNKRTRKASKVFVPIDEYVILRFEDFLSLLSTTKLKEFNTLKPSPEILQYKKRLKTVFKKPRKTK